jgi:hypothetical protein
MKWKEQWTVMAYGVRCGTEGGGCWAWCYPMGRDYVIKNLGWGGGGKSWIQNMSLLYRLHHSNFCISRSLLMTRGLNVRVYTFANTPRLSNSIRFVHGDLLHWERHMSVHFLLPPDILAEEDIWNLRRITIIIIICCNWVFTRWQ